jgi:hypothetical protein
MPKQVTPLCKIYVYRPDAVPYFGVGSDLGASWHSVLSREAEFGTYSYNTGTVLNGVPAYVNVLEYIGKDRMRDAGYKAQEIPIGLVCRPFIVPQDIGNWDEMDGNAGTFELIRPYVNPPTQRLVQVDPSVDDSGITQFVPFGAYSTANHPANPSFAFTVLPVTVNPEYDELVGGIPYCQVAWSNGDWAIRFFHNGSPILMRMVNGVLSPVMELQSPARQSQGDNPEEIIGIVRVQRGALMISLDNGASYDVWWELDGSNVACVAGQYQFTGQGCVASLGIHQVVYVTGQYESPRNAMTKVRATSPTAEYEGALNGGSITLTDLGSTTYMQYRATLTPTSVPGSDWPYYYSPEVYTVTLNYPCVPLRLGITGLLYGIHDNGLTFEGRLRNVEVSREALLDESSCTWTARYRTSEAPDLNLGLRLIRVYGGWEYDDGSFRLELLFTGYITEAEVVQSDANTMEVRFTAQNTSARAKRLQWRGDNLRPFDGLTLNQAFLRWAEDMGLNSSYLVPHARGNLISVPQVVQEDPAYIGTEGEGRWQLMSDLFRYGQMELGVLNDGSYAAVPNNTFNLTTNFWAALPSARGLNDTARIESLTYGQRYLDTYTGVTVKGRTKLGAQISAWLEDEYALTDINSPRFKPWPEWHVETIDHPVSQAWLGFATTGIAYEKMVPKHPVTWKGDTAFQIGRRDAIQMYDAKVGIGSAVWVGVLEIRHFFNMQDGNQAWTEITGVRLANATS